jgi:hypothetical protein
MQPDRNREVADLLHWSVKETPMLPQQGAINIRISICQQQEGLDDSGLVRDVSEKYIEKKQTLSPVRWIRNLDIKMRSQNRDILLLIDNFSGHFINYIPQNIDIVYFTPNITSHIQPLDAGAIRCLKAWYKRLFCERAIDLDNANEAEIYKINLYESMRLTEKAWSWSLPRPS